MKTMPKTFLIASLVLASQDAFAQGGDPMREIQEIAESVDEQLKEIDRLLLESGKQDQARALPKQKLVEAIERSLTVQDGLDKLIEKLNEMKNQGGGGGGGQSDQQPQDGQQQDGQQRPQQGQQGNRRENQTPDYVQQPQQGEQQGEQQQQQGQQQQQQGGQPQGGQEAPGPGQNEPGNTPPQSETGPGQPGTGEGQWGELQPYLNFLRNRGASPKVPDKYRKYYEAYLKQKQGGK